MQVQCRLPFFLSEFCLYSSTCHQFSCLSLFPLPLVPCFFECFCMLSLFFFSQFSNFSIFLWTVCLSYLHPFRRPSPFYALYHLFLQVFASSLYSFWQSFYFYLVHLSVFSFHQFSYPYVSLSSVTCVIFIHKFLYVWIVFSDLDLLVASILSPFIPFTSLLMSIFFSFLTVFYFSAILQVG